MRDAVPPILVVDDDASIREALTVALEGMYMVHGAASGDQACAFLRRQPISVIVLDVLLGPESGINLIDRFRVLSQAPILILTGHGTEEVAAYALRAGANDYLKKPVNVLELRAAIARVMEPKTRPSDAASRARHLMTEHPDRPYTTGRLAKDVGLSDRQLRRRFHDTYGKTPRRYLAEVRLRRAVELLLTTELGIEQIARATGYQNVAAFDRIFKRAFGVTPSEARTTRGSSIHQADG